VREKYCWMAADSADPAKRTGWDGSACKWFRSAIGRDSGLGRSGFKLINHTATSEKQPQPPR
jgi:hypothetical protein